MPADPLPPVESLIPHRGPARLVHGILQADKDGILCEASIPADHPLVHDGLAPGWLALEAAAQAAAALEALARRDQDPGPRLGYLVGIREARIETPRLQTGISFQIEVRVAGGAPPLAIYQARAERDGRPVLAARISTYIPPG
jgi:predicted hotdog family 3-hydroxylacyl-ACP dehydratase